MTDVVESDDLTLLDRDAALVAFPSDAMLIARGADRIGFLHRLLTVSVADLAPGQGRRGLLLTAKGQVTSDIHLFVDADSVRMLVPIAQAESTVAALSHFAIMDDFSCEVVPEQSCLAVLGPNFGARLTQAGVTLPAGFAIAPTFTHTSLDAPLDDLWVARVAALGAEGVVLFGSPGKIAELRGRLQTQTPPLPSLAERAAEVRRIDVGEPRFGSDFGVVGEPGRFPMEVGLEGALDYQKGCYLGQEPIVRIRDLGHVNWRLARLRFPGNGPLPSPGDGVSSPERESAGKVTSVAPHLGEEAEGQALGLIHHSIPDGSTVQIDTTSGKLPALVIQRKSR